MIPAITQQVLDFLGNPASYAHCPARVELHQTHASWVFIASPFVIKIKKPVDFGFMNFTTLELRKANCEREVALNRRLAPDIYLGIEPICLVDGRVQFGPQGEIVEWAVKMREMNPRDFLSHRVDEHRFAPADLDRVIARLVEFYKSQPPLGAEKTQAAAAQMKQNILANYTVARRFIPDVISKEALYAIENYTQVFERRNADLLASRPAFGKIRDCHGDLHLEHIYLSPKRVDIYDCIEFNSDFRYIDIACDIAFLAMDLDFHGESAASRRLIDQISKQLDDPAILKLADYYKSYRACVRGKVAALQSAGETITPEEKAACLALARRYFQLALRYALTGSAPTAVVIMGGVGAGKTSLATSLAQETNWPHHSSDPLRKTLAGVPLTERGTAEQRATLYSSEMTAKVYAALAEEALKNLRRGENAIIDATFSRPSQRADFSAALATEGYSIIWIEAFASQETILERLRARETTEGVISDARAEDFSMLQKNYEPPKELSVIAISTDTPPPKPLQQLLGKLSQLESRL